MTRARPVAMALAFMSATALSAHAAPQSALAFTGVRPGSLLWSQTGTHLGQGELCTAGFVYQDAPGAFDPAAQLYIGTAGHCVTAGQTVYVAAVGPAPSVVVRPTPDGTRFARLGTAVLVDAWRDFALVAIDPAMNQWVSPSMAYVGGPTGVLSSGASLTTLVGHGLGIGTGGTLRVNDGGTDPTDASRVVFGGPVTVGDSGAPMTTAGGLALGIQTNLASDMLGVPEVGIGPGTGVSAAYTEALTGKAIATCPKRTPWPLPGCPPT